MKYLIQIADPEAGKEVNGAYLVGFDQTPEQWILFISRDPERAAHFPTFSDAFNEYIHPDGVRDDGAPRRPLQELFVVDFVSLAEAREQVRERLEESPMTEEQIEATFTYHAPNDDQVARYEALRNEARMLAYRMQDMCPESREKSLAFTALQQTIMWANAAIAINSSKPAQEVTS